MKSPLCTAQLLTALVAAAASFASHGFDRAAPGHIAQVAAAGKNHFILCEDERHRCANAEGWIATASLNVVRKWASAALLPDGKVLVAAGGGAGIESLASAELYDPVTESWSYTGGMHVGRMLATTTLLPSAKVMVVGGLVPDPDFEFGITAAVEIYDPAAGLWSLTGSMHRVRAGHTATLLQTGSVLVVAGGAEYEVVGSVELYDPLTGNWSPTGSLAAGPREGHTATLLQDGRVLVAGGWAGAYGGGPVSYGDVSASASAELYDPSAGTWSRVGDMGTPRIGHTAMALPSGKVLVTGGGNRAVHGLVSAELFDPATGLWTPTGDLGEGRVSHTATLLPDGNVLVVSGFADDDDGLTRVVSSTEVYDTASGKWRRGVDLGQGRIAHTATLLADGTVLVAGGMEIVNATASSYQTRPIGTAELWQSLP